MATTKTLTPTNQAITLTAFTEKPDNRTNVTNDDKLADAVNALNSNITTMNSNITLLESEPSILDFSGSSETTISLPVSANKFLLITIMLYNTAGNIVNAVTASPVYFRNLITKIYGESSSQWGTFQLSADYTQATMNRTSSNTMKVRVIESLRFIN